MNSEMEICRAKQEWRRVELPFPIGAQHPHITSLHSPPRTLSDPNICEFILTFQEIGLLIESLATGDCSTRSDLPSPQSCTEGTNLYSLLGVLLLGAPLLNVSQSLSEIIT